jgi:hypothetical protein
VPETFCRGRTNITSLPSFSPERHKTLYLWSRHAGGDCAPDAPVKVGHLAAPFGVALTGAWIRRAKISQLLSQENCKDGCMCGIEAETIHQPRDRLKGQLQERQHSAAESGTRDRRPPALAKRIGSKACGGNRSPSP